MSKKIGNNKVNTNNANSRIAIISIAVGVLVFAAVATMFLFPAADTPSSAANDTARQAALASEHSPSHGDPNAKVQIVEFLDPACGTCAMFYPMVKQWMSEMPGQIHLSIRHVPFHAGSDYAVKILEASRKQDKYWETLETLLATQRQWVQNHVVKPEMIAPAIAGVGLDMDQLMADMNTMEVMLRMEQDKKDAVFLEVTATPEYFVNGRPLPSFGKQQLADLIREELEK